MKRVVVILVALAALFALGCRTKQEVLRFGIIKPSIDHLPYTWGVEKGVIDKAKYQTIAFTSGWEIQEALVAGRIDAAIIPFTYVWNAATQGHPVRTVSFFERETDGILAQPNIRSPQDLEGRKVGLLKASTLDVLWQDYAKRKGISAQPIYFRTPSEAVSALQNRDLDAIVTYVPIINKLSDKFNVIHWFGDFHPAHPCCDLAVNTAQITPGKKKLLIDLYSNLEKAINAMTDVQDSVRQFVQEYYGLTHSQADSALEHTIFRMGLDESGKQFQHEMAVYSRESGYLKAIPNFEDVYWDLGIR